MRSRQHSPSTPILSAQLRVPPRLLVIASIVLSGTLPAFGQLPFRRGDTDGNGVYEITDSIANIAFQFLGTFVPGCKDALDYDDSGLIDITDPVAQLSFQFAGLGLPPAPPGGVCGFDPTDDDLDCGESSHCDLPPPGIRILFPPTLTVLPDESISVSGEFTGVVESIDVNGVPAEIGDGTFSVPELPLVEGTNILVATARGPLGATGSSTVSVRRDTEAPLVVFETPLDGDRFITDTILVAGTVNDIIPGATTNEDDVQVTINGEIASVNNRSFFLEGVPLEIGANTLTAVAVDIAGNERTTSIVVTREPDLTGIRIQALSGNAQSGAINEQLSEPLRIGVEENDGSPVAARPVVFQVSRGDGFMGDPAEARRSVTLLTDASGEAEVEFTMGSRTGVGFHRVRVTTPGSLTFVEFCATAQPAMPARINAVMIPPTQGLAGQPLPTPLSVILTDDGGNPVPGFTVTYAVQAGEGNFGGEPSTEAITDRDGIALAMWTLGPDAGLASNEATATFEGNPGLPVTFSISGVKTGPVENTTVSGIVQNSAAEPIVGAVAMIRDTELEAETRPDGRFVIANVPPGGHRVAILGSAASEPPEIYYPDIDFVIEAKAGVENKLDQIVILPFLDRDGEKLVGGDEDVVLEMEGVPGASIRIFARSVILPDGFRGEIPMSSSQVKFDKVPMPPPQGATPLVVGTLQPPGIRFDPPAQVTYPNVEGLAPGDVADIFAFHHDIGQFVNVGPGTVSDDGSVVTSDPGFGIVVSGWHCLIRMPGPTGNCRRVNTCRGDWEWSVTTNAVNGAASKPVKDQPVYLCTLTNPAKAERASVTVTFQPAGAIEGGWTSQDPSIVKIVGGATTATVQIEAVGAGRTTITSVTNRAPDPRGGPDITCEVEIPVYVVTFALSNQMGVSEPNAATPVVGVAPNGKAAMGFVGVAPAKYTPKVTITAADTATAKQWEAGLIQNLLADDIVYTYSNGVKRESVIDPVPIKDGAPPASGLFDDVFAQRGDPTVLDTFTSSGDDVQLMLPDTPSNSSYINLLDNPECAPALGAALLEKAVSRINFRTWVGVRHKPTGTVKTLHHIDWETDWEATITYPGGTATVTPNATANTVTVSNGDGSPAFIQGKPVANDASSFTCN